MEQDSNYTTTPQALGAPIRTDITGDMQISVFNKSGLGELKNFLKKGELPSIAYEQNLAIQWHKKILEDEDLTGLNTFYDNHCLLKKSLIEDIQTRALVTQNAMLITHRLFMIALIVNLCISGKNYIKSYLSQKEQTSEVKFLLLNFLLIFSVTAYTYPLYREVKAYSKHIDKQITEIDLIISKIEATIQALKNELNSANDREILDTVRSRPYHFKKAGYIDAKHYLKT